MPQFTTVTKVREDAGFVNNSNVTDAQVSSFIDAATAEVESAIGDIYVIPIPKFYENEIVFTGTGTGSDTMTITIDGTNFDIAITSGLTASQAADLFRTAVLAESDLDFITDGIGAGATVSLKTNNQDEDQTDVTITSTDPQTVEAIVATGGTVTEIAPDLIEIITRCLASGRLLIQDYGPESQNTDKDGYKRLDFCRETLDEIQAKKLKIRDPGGTELTLSDTKKVKFFPTEASRTDEDEPTANRFTMNGKF